MTQFSYPDLGAQAQAELSNHAVGALEALKSINARGGVHALLLKHNNHEWKDGAEPKFIADFHFPKGDRIDYETGSQYFYHCHREDYETEEHGHFHVFIRKKAKQEGCGWPEGVELLDVPEADKFIASPMTHLVCIAMNRSGMPIRLFTVNRWVTRETMFAPDQMKDFAKKFDATNAKGDAELHTLDHFITHVMALFNPQIEYLLDQRDVKMANAIAAHSGDDNPYLSKDIEELSSLDIALEAQVAWLMDADEDAAVA